MRGPNGEDLPGSVLFCCTMNALRSPMAEALMKHFFGRTVYVDSAGVRPGELDPFAITVMDEIGIDISAHRPKTFDDLEDDLVDLIVSMSPEAQHRAVEFTRVMDCDIEYWPTLDPSAMIGSASREQVLDAYRGVRDALAAKIKARFGGGATPSP